MRDPAEYEHCGCCGRRLRDPDALWCLSCESHVGTAGPLWDRTFEAMSGQACPRQVVRG